MHRITQYLPLVFSLCFIGILLGVRGLRFRRRFGYSPFRFPRWRDRSAAAFVSRMLVVVLAAIVLLATAAALVPERLAQFDPLYRYRGPTLLTAGALWMLVGAAIVWKGQDDMREAWRVGIDEREHTRLVTQGLFQFCRNPIYLGLQAALVGFVGVVPGCFSLVLLAISLALCQVQSRLEESYLLSQHGAAYAEYCRRVGRFLPWTGRRTLRPANRKPRGIEP